MNSDLQQLKDIHLPQAISWWPIAPGWIFILTLLLGIMLYLFFAWQKRRKRKYTINFALTKLTKLQQLMIENPEKINIAAEISTLLRRTALYYFRRDDIASLSGKNWLDFLNRSGNTTKFTHDVGYLLTDTPYQKDNIVELTPLFILARAWLITISKKNITALEK